MSTEPNYLTGKITCYQDRKELEEYFERVYEKHCTPHKYNHYCAIHFDYNTGLLAIASPRRKEYTALEPFVNSRGFIALFYKGKLLTIERRELI